MSPTGPITSPLALLVAAFIVGLSGAMSPGPYLTVTIARTMQRGRTSALLMLVGHALLEALLLVGFAFGLQEVFKQPTVAQVMALAGGAVLLWMGFGLLRGAITGAIAKDLEHAEEVGAEESRFGPVVHGALVSISNPYWTLWWATIGVGLATVGLSFGPIGVLAFFIGHQLADIAWYTFVVLAVHSGKHLLSPAVYRVVIGVLACFLLYLGVTFGLHGAGVT